MAKTRRQKAAADAAESAPQSPATSTAPASQPSAALAVDIPEDIDFDVLSSLLPDTRLDTPTPDAILYLYRLVVNQAADGEAAQRELEEARSDLSRKDVELDQALQDRESATRDLEETLENVQKELDQVKQEKEEITVARAALQAQLATVSTSQTSSSAEVESLKHRIEDTEREKRDLVGIVSRLKEDASQREDEIKTLRANLKQARHDHQTLESQVRELRSTDASTQFKLDSLQQQLKLAKDEAERSSSELATKSEEFAKYRRSQHAEFVQLQAAHDALTQNHATTESTLKALQSTHNAQTSQLTQALARIQDLSGQLAEQEATYSSEAANLRRLVQMMEDREKEAKSIVDSIEAQWAEVGERADRREAVLQEEIESQKERAEAAEKKVDELQDVIGRIERGEFPVPSTTAGSVPTTPARGVGSPMFGTSPSFTSPGMLGLSPTVAIASRVQKGGKTFTEVYTDYVKLQEDYARKSAEYDQMAETLQRVLDELEQRAPVLNQQRDEYDRLQNEANLLASQLSNAISERDASAASAEENAQKLAKSARETELLNKQLNDLGRQVQALLKELGRRQDPSIPTDEELEADPNTQPAENIEAVIENNLVLFRSIPALQEMNQKLLRIVRELGEKLESEEKEYKEQVDAEHSVALQEAYTAITTLQQQLEDNKKHAETTIQAYIKERDALKSMLVRERALASAGANGAGARPDSMVVDSDAAKELEDITSQFEAYKTEMGADSGKLREELVAVRHEASRASTELAKANAKVEYLSDRLRMLQEQNNAQSLDMNKLSSRNQDLIHRYTEADTRCGELAADLVTAKTTIEQLRNEAANLRAERKIWENTQARLIEENKSLSVERGHLANLMSNVQRMHNDLEHAGENDRRRLEIQVQSLENQTQDLRTQLSKERDTIRHLTLQKDLELKDLRVRIEKATEEHAKTREALVGAQTSKTHLEEQIERLSRQLQGNEEKLAVYERRPAGLTAVPHAEETEQQQLQSEVAELRSRLKVAEVDLAAARTHVQQYQEISQASEAALAALSTTYDEYKVSTEAQIAKHQSDVNALQERLQTATQELQSLSTKNAEIQRTLETERKAWAMDKKTLEDTIVEMTTAEQGTEGERAAHTAEVRQLEERARAAEDRYGREVVSHAESLKTVDTLRQQLTTAEASARENLAAAETAQAKLKSSETSWKQQRDALDKEISDLNARCRDLGEQNALLHKHLETVSSQAARIKQAADSSATPVGGEASTSDDADTKLADLRSVVAYLRKEKEIVDLQLELGKQETARLRTQIEHLTNNLEETRKTLSEERERAIQAATSDAQHAELVERINQLTILRESNATLRADCESHAKKARSLETNLQQLSSELEPTKEQLRIARAELDAREAQIKRLEDESRRWQERNAQLLTKYDRIDPAEVQALKDQIETLTAAKTELEAAQTSQQTAQDSKVAELEARVVALRNTGKQNNEISNRRNQRQLETIAGLNTKITELEEQLKSVTAERDELRSKGDGAARTEELSTELKKLQEEKVQLEQRVQELQNAPPPESTTTAVSAENEAALAALQQERDALLAEKATWSATPATATVEGGQAHWEAEKVELVKARDDAQAHAKRSTERVNQLAQELKQLRMDQAKLNFQLQEAEKQRTAEKERALAEQKSAVDAAVEKVKAELQSATATSESAPKHADELRELEARLTKKHHEELQKAVNAAKAAATNDIAVPPDAKASVDAAVAAREAQLKAEYEQKITSAMESGRMEGVTKLKLKDAQVVRLQNRLKDFEGQIEELKKAGVEIPPPPSKVGPTASTSNIKPTPGGPPTRPAAGGPPTHPAHPPGGPKAAAGNRPPHVPGLPQRPGGGPAGQHPHPGAGRGRGIPGRGRGGPGGVAAAAGLSIRGAAPAATEGAEGAAADGVAIVGAGKRAREEGEASGDDSLAKRLKPEGTGTSRPVPIQRNRVHPPAPAP